MSPEAKLNRGFPKRAGRRAATDYADAFNDVDCGRCGEVVPAGTAHIVVHYHHASGHQLFCPGCCPCRRKPGSVRPVR